MTGTLLDVSDLSVTFNPPTGAVRAVRDVDLAISAGEVLGIVGESGSGKSVTVRSVLGLTPPSASVGGTVTIDGTTGTPRDMSGAAQKMSALVYQNPGAALNPVVTIGRQLRLLSGGADDEELESLLGRVGLPDPKRAMQAYPHEFSGGMQQRAVIAMALSQQPKLLIADEPTTALDVTTEAQILDLILGIRDERNLAVVFISHDLDVIGKVADRVAVMQQGVVVETGTTQQVLHVPQHPYTQKLIASAPSRTPAAITHEPDEHAILEIRNLAVDYRDRNRTSGGKVRVLEDLNLSVVAGETLALVGESGSGKSTLANAIAGLVPVANGSIHFQSTELTALNRKARRATRAQLQMVFQNPLLSLSPRRSIRWQLHEALRLHTGMSSDERNGAIEGTFERLGLSVDLVERKPHELSGGQAQRVVLARALVLEPRCIIFDEPTSALDVSVQAEVLELLSELQAEHGLTYLFITHDLAVARYLADRIAVLRTGKIVELSATADLFNNPAHEYTKSLLDASPTV